MRWDIDRINDGLASFATGQGNSITFTVPANSNTSQFIRITLTGDGGTATRDYAIVTRPIQTASVRKYDIFERSVTNANSYTNKFDFNVIELRTTFASPSGKTYSFFGFYDGDGQGGQSGNVWKFRFMPALFRCPVRSFL